MPTLQGTFYAGYVRGVEYSTQTLSGLVGDAGEYAYREGETVTFSVGGLVLGSAPAAGSLTPADLALEVGGDVRKLANPKVTNVTRLLLSLDGSGDLERGFTITDAIRETVARHRYAIGFDQFPEAFSQDAGVTALLADLGTTLKTPAEARNHLRRTLLGIRKLTDVEIPTRDGSYLLADVYVPLEAGRYPVVMSLGAYGKAFTFGVICSEEDRLTHEELEDGYFQGRLPPPSTFGMGDHPVVPHVSENFELANTAEWVPRGYAVVRVDERGAGRSPGGFEQFSLQEARDYYDAIEWAGAQEWSNGNVGLYGGSYYAMNQYNVAQLQPPSLKAMIPIAGDVDSYRDYVYSGGGLYNPFNFVARNSCGEWRGVNWVEIARENEFAEPEIYGPEGSICISVDLDKVTVPFWSAMGTEGTIHTRGSSEAYVHAASRHKKLLILSEPGIHFWMYAGEYPEAHIRFFDHWLKGVENEVMDEPPVKMMIRTGRGGYHWRTADDWPVPGTEYVRYHLDCSPADWAGDGRRSDFLRLSAGAPTGESSITYSADVDREAEPCWSHGVSFVSEPLAEDLVVAGYPKLVLWVSSSSEDMQIHAAVRVLDENGVEIPYVVGSPSRFGGFPVGQGALKVSHRKLDPERSTPYRPFHTHRRADRQPLAPGEIVEVEVEIWPTTALVRRRHRLRLDVQPVTGCGFWHPLADPAGDGYQRGASNSIHTGPDRPCYLQLPVLPGA